MRRAREEMGRRGIGLMFLTYGANLWYLAGVHRRQPHNTETNAYGDHVCGAYIGADGGLILVAPRMGGSFFQREAEGKPWIDEVRIIDESERPGDVLAEVVGRFGLKGEGVSFDDRAWMRSGLLFQHVLPDGRFSLASEIIAPMRMIKDEDEIALMQEAGRITVEVYGEVLDFIDVGVTEREVAHEIERLFSKHGVEYTSFVTDVRFSSPEARQPGPSRATGRRLEEGDAITFDFGACHKGYCSDFGRTAFVGEPPAGFRRIHDLVMEAQAAAISRMVSGAVTATQLDRVARGIIERGGYGEGFTHRLGHGIGVTVHEPPFLYPPDETTLVSGMTFTVEPSIRLPDGYSCRVEDVVMVTEEGGLPLSNFHKELTVIE
ncbi:MAG: M24 family metallopeptidase [Candidatus Bathyarchaeia archaeon]